MPQPRLKRQSGLNDMSLLQQHIMFKQLQELQREQQLQNFGDSKPRNSMNLPMIMKQASGGQFHTMINGTPIHDTSQPFMNWIPHSASQSVQGVTRGLMALQEQGQALRSLGLSPLHPDVSLYGTPVGRGSFSQNSYLQEMSGDSANSLLKTGFTRPQKPTVQLPAFCNSILGDQGSISQKQAFMPDGALIPGEGFQRRNPYGQVPYQDLSNGVHSENFEQENTVQGNTSAQKLYEMQGQADLAGLFLGKPTQIVSSPGMIALDPVEQKVLFSIDNNISDASHWKPTGIAAGCFGNTMEQPNHSNVFSYVQSGSYSALMQSAVAEASSSDTGLQEEWSGLSFQNTDLSTDNQPSNIVDSGMQQNYWTNDNMQSASSFCSKPSPHFNGSNMTPNFSCFQQSGSHLSFEQREGLYPDSSHESIHQSPDNDGPWFDSNPQQKSSIEESQQFQPLMQLEHAWNDRTYEHSERNAQQQSIFARNNSSQPCNKPKGRIVETLPSFRTTATPNIGDNEKIIQHCCAYGVNEDQYKGKEFDVHLWKTDDDCLDPPLSTSVSGLDLRQSNAHNRAQDILETSERLPDNQQLDYVKHLNSFMKHNDIEIMTTDKQQLSNSTQLSIHSYRGEDAIFDNRQNCYKNENSPSDSYNSISSQRTITGCESRENLWSNATESWALTRDNQNSPSLLSHGSRGHDQGCFAGSKSTLYDSHSALGMEKGHLTDFQGNLNASVDMVFKSNLISNPSSTQDGLGGFYGSGIAAQTSQNMPELLRGQFRKGSKVSQTELRFTTQLQQLPNSNNTLQYLPETGKFPATRTSSTPYLRNQHQGHFNSNAIPYQSSHMTWPGTVSRLPPLNLATQDTSQQLYASSSAQHSEALHDSQSSIVSGVLQRGGFSVRPPNNVWEVLPNQPFSAFGLHKVPSTNSSNHREINDLNLLKSGNGISGFGAYSLNSNDYDSEKGQSLRESSQQPADMHPPAALNLDYPQGKESAASTSESLLHLQYLEKLRSHANQDPAVSSKDFNAFSRPPQQVKEGNVKTDKSKIFPSQDVQQITRMARQKALCKYTGRVGNFMDTGMNVGSWIKSSFPFEDTRMQSSVTGARADQTVGTSLEPILQSQPSLETVKFGWNDSRGRSINTHMVTNQMENSNSPISEAVGPPWFKQYESIKNGQTMSMHSGRLASEHIPYEKASENLCVLNVDSTFPSAAPVLVGSEHQPKPEVMSSGVTGPILSVLGPKKRKTATSLLLPWHKEVTHGSQTFQNISMAEQDWAQVTNHMVEKMEDRTYAFEVGFPISRAKRRLIMATHQMQQLLRAVPAAILSSDALSNHDCVVYSVAKLALGDACTLASSTGSSLDGTASENIKTSETIDNTYLLKAVEGFANRAKKLEGDLLRLDNTVSFLGLSLECQELEKYTLLNRFAKFYVPVQSDAAETSSSSSAVVAAPRQSLPRYVTVVPQPIILPEQAQCFSL